MAKGRGAVETILARRSVRAGYTDRPVNRTDLEVIVCCGGAAPSSKDARPWRFHVVTDQAVLRRIAAAVEGAPGAATYVPTDPTTGAPRPDWPSTVAESADVVRQVPACLFVENKGTFSNGRTHLATSGPDVLRESLVGYTFEVLGIGTAIENAVIAANALGLGCAFMGDVVVADDAIRAVLGIQGDLVGVIVVGYTDPSSVPPPRQVDPHDPDLAVWH